MSLPQSTAYTVLLKVYLSSDHVSPATGKTVAVVLSKAGAAFANPSAGATNATEVANGWYSVALSATDTNTTGDLIVRGTASGCDDSERVLQVVNANTGGLSALPNVAAGNAGAVVTSGTGTSQLSVSSGAVTVGTNNDKTGYSLSQAFPANFSSLAIAAGGAVTAGTVSDKTGYSLTQAFPANFASLLISASGHISNVDTLTTYTGNTPQTGDAYARLGAPAGATVSVDVAAVKSELDAVKAKTDLIVTATLANGQVPSGTVISSLASYATVSQFLLRVDYRSVGRLLTDDDSSATPTQAQVLASATLPTLLLEASGWVEAACLRGGMYTGADLVSLAGTAGGELLASLVSDLTLWRLFDRRPDRRSETPERCKVALETLDKLGRGELIFGLSKSADSGHINTGDVMESDLRARQPSIEQARRRWGKRAQDWQ